MIIKIYCLIVFFDVVIFLYHLPKRFTFSLYLNLPYDFQAFFHNFGKGSGKLDFEK